MRSKNMKSESSRKKLELFFGLVGPTGTDLSFIQDHLEKLLVNYSYKINPIKISDFFEDKRLKSAFKLKSKGESEDNKISSDMDAGTQIRKKTNSKHFLSAYCAAEIYRKRRTGKVDYSGTVHVFRSLKNPEETKFLRKAYGFGYFQFAVYSTEEERIDFLKTRKEIDEIDSLKLIKRDQQEKDKDGFGQETRETFHLSDFFIRHDPIAPEKTIEQIHRDLDLIFGNPHVTPTLDEHLMFMAFSFANRSGDLSRQVGAIIANGCGDIRYNRCWVK